MDIRKIVERLHGRGFVIESSYLTEDGQLMVRIDGVTLSFFDQAVRLAEGRTSIQDLVREDGASPAN